MASAGRAHPRRFRRRRPRGGWRPARTSPGPSARGGGEAQGCAQRTEEQRGGKRGCAQGGQPPPHQEPRRLPDDVRHRHCVADPLAGVRLLQEVLLRDALRVQWGDARQRRWRVISGSRGTQAVAQARLSRGACFGGHALAGGETRRRLSQEVGSPLTSIMTPVSSADDELASGLSAPTRPRTATYSGSAAIISGAAVNTGKSGDEGGAGQSRRLGTTRAIAPQTPGQQEVRRALLLSLAHRRDPARATPSWLI